MAAVKKIAEAIKSISGKKESLRESLEVVKSYSSSLATFALEWKDLDDHLSAIEKSIDDRFKALEAKEEKLLLLGKSNNTSNSNKNDKLPILRKEEEEEEEEEEASPRPQLKSLCVRMDARGLAAFMENLRSEDMNAVKKELAPALRFAPDPAQLVLDAVAFHSNPPNSKLREGAGYAPSPNRRSCINLLEKLQLVAPEIGPAVREKALMRAAEWKAKISFDKGGDHSLDVISFLQLVASFNIVANFDHDEILELFSTISRRRQALGLVKNLGLIDNLTELIQKLSSKGRQLDAVKIIYFHDMAEKFPPVPLLEAYVKDSKKIAEEIQKRGKNSRQSQNEATAKEMGALKSVIKAIEDYKLENEYPCQDLENRLSQLEQQKPNKKRDAPSASVSSSKNQKQQQQQHQQHQRQSNKRARQSRQLESTAFERPRQSRQLETTATNAMPANPYPSLIQNHPQHGLADHASYLAGPYSLTASGSVYNHVGQSLSGTALGHSGTRSPPRPYLYSSDAFAGTSGLYDRPVTYSGYPPSGLPPPYGSSLYP